MTRERAEFKADKSLLSDIRILQELDKGRIVIHPFRQENLGSVSYDVCLGEYFFKEQHPKIPQTLFNPYNQQHAKRICGEAKHAPKAPA